MSDKSCCCYFNVIFEEHDSFNCHLCEDDSFFVQLGQIHEIHTDNYEDLYNKPSINEVELVGNKSFEELGDHTLTNIEIKTIFNRVFS